MKKSEEQLVKEEQIRIENMLFLKFGQIQLSKQITAKLMGFSASKLDKLRGMGLCIPYSKETETSNVMYSITDIAKYLSEKKIKTA